MVQTEGRHLQWINARLWPAKSCLEPVPAMQRKGRHCALNYCECCPGVNCPLRSPGNNEERLSAQLHHLAAVGVCAKTENKNRDRAVLLTQGLGVSLSAPQNQCPTTKARGLQWNPWG